MADVNKPIKQDDKDQESPVDPNYAPSQSQPSESEVGATSPIDHPCTMSSVDGNYTPGSPGSWPSGRGKGPREESSDVAGVSGAQDAKYTDDSEM